MRILLTIAVLAAVAAAMPAAGPGLISGKIYPPPAPFPPPAPPWTWTGPPVNPPDEATYVYYRDGITEGGISYPPGSWRYLGDR